MDGLLLYSFDYKAGGVIYSVSSGTFTGKGTSARISEFESLLRAHPEGVVVWGEWAASTGTHGVLVTGVIDGEVYAMDSSYNMGCFKEGIQKWTDTTMLDPSLCTDYWFINNITPEGTTDIRTLREESIDALHFNLLRQGITSV